MKPRAPLKYLSGLCLLLCLALSACRVGGSGADVDRRISDAPIIPGYIVSPTGMQVVREPNELTRLRFSALPGSYGFLGGKSAALRIAVFSVDEEWTTRVGIAGQGQEIISGEFLGEIGSEPDGSVRDTSLNLNENLGYLLLFVFDKAGGTEPRPVAVTAGDSTAIVAPVSDVGVGYFSNLFPVKPLGLWTSKEETRDLNQKSIGFRYILARANYATAWTNPSLGEPGNLLDSSALAAAIAYTADSEAYSAYRRKIIDAIGSVLAKGRPENSVVWWASNIVGLVIAAELVGYRTPAFDKYLINLSNVWTGKFGEQALTLTQVWNRYANTAGGMQAALALATIHSYLGDKAQLLKLLNQWKSLLNGKPTLALHWMTTPWQPDPSKKYFINPLGASVNCSGSEVAISGAMPQFMGRNDPCKGELAKGREAWKSLEAMVSMARIAERQGLPLWGAGNNAILRAVRAIGSTYRTPVKAYPSMAWMLKFIDKRYGTNLSCALTDIPANFEWIGGTLGYSWVEGTVLRNCPPRAGN